MAKEKRTVTNDTKRNNRNKVFRFIYENRTVSRQDIADGLDLSLPTVNQNIYELFDLGYVDYSGNFQSTGGRKAQAIMVPREIRYAISVNIHAKSVRASLINLYGEASFSKEYSEEFSTEDRYYRLLGKIVRDMLQEADGGIKNILGVGITLPGIVDRENKILLSAPTLNIVNYDLNQLIQYIELDCCFENDARSFAYTQMWKEGNFRKSLSLLIDFGVGGSVMVSKDDFVSASNRAGEFGHMIIHPNGKKCSCGRKGCLEAYVSSGILSDDLGIKMSDFFKNVEKDASYREILNAYLDDLALGVNNIATMYGAPVVIGGEITKYLERYMPELMSRIDEYNAGFMHKVKVSLAISDKGESMIGAALMYIDDFVKNL